MRKGKKENKKLRGGSKIRLSKSLIVLVLLLFVSFQGSAKEPITFVVHGSTGAIAEYKALFNMFTAETGIEVEVIHTNTAIKTKWEKIITLTAGGVSPDVVSGVSTEFGEYAFSGLLEPLDDYISRDRLNKSDLIPSFTNALQLNGQQYVLPYGSSAFVMAHNTSHFAEAGLSRPPTTWANGDWSWKDYVQTATKLTITNGDQTQRWGANGYPHWQYTPYAFGGRWVSQDLTRFMGTDEQSIAALQSLRDLAYVHKALNPVGVQDDFLNAKSSTAMVGTWLLPRLADANIEWNFMPWFQFENQDPAGVIFPVGYGILSNSTHKEEAWELIKWLTWNRDANFDYALSAGAVPSMRSNLVRWAQKQQSLFGIDIDVKVVADQVETYNAVVDIRKSPVFSEIDPVMLQAVNAVFRNQEAPRTSMEKIEGQINQLLQKYEK